MTANPAGRSAAAMPTGQAMPALNEAEWLITLASVRGKGHIDKDFPCQDWCTARTSAEGAWVVAVACDGAGSAPRSEEGARTVAEGLADRLIALTPKIEARGPGPWLRDEVQRALIELRDVLREKGNIKEYDCTLVALLMGRSGGMFVHIGDGFALGSSVLLNGDDASAPISLWSGLVKSLPENGEYANETVFVTEDDWYAHLRSTPLSRDLDILVLTTDGMMPFLLLKGFEPNSRFIDPVVSQLLLIADPTERERLMRSWLAAPDTYPFTDDDKTLVVLLRRKLVALADRPVAPHRPEPPKPPHEPGATGPMPIRDTSTSSTVPARESQPKTAVVAPARGKPEGSVRPAPLPVGLLWSACALSVVAVLVSLASGYYVFSSLASKPVPAAAPPAPAIATPAPAPSPAPPPVSAPAEPAGEPADRAEGKGTEKAIEKTTGKAVAKPTGKVGR